MGLDIQFWCKCKRWISISLIRIMELAKSDEEIRLRLGVSAEARLVG